MHNLPDGVTQRDCDEAGRCIGMGAVGLDEQARRLGSAQLAFAEACFAAADAIGRWQQTLEGVNVEGDE